LKIDVVNFLTDAQVLLFYQAEANGYILREFSQPDGHYELLCGPACSLGRSGKYLIHIFAPANHPSLPNQYTIEATLLP
jgi:hypothetical protein